MFPVLGRAQFERRAGKAQWQLRHCLALVAMEIPRWVKFAALHNKPCYVDPSQPLLLLYCAQFAPGLRLVLDSYINLIRSDVY